MLKRGEPWGVAMNIGLHNATATIMALIEPKPGL